MRRVLQISLASAFAILAAPVVVPTTAEAQARQPQQGRQEQQQEGQQRERRPRVAPLSRSAAAGPCPYVKILYDAARYVEIAGDRVAASNVGFTGEVEGLSSVCSYQNDQPITVLTRILFNLGRGPQASGDARTYRYWIAVTERNRAVLAKEYFDLPVNFDGQPTASVTQEQTIVIPRAQATTSGDNFEILVGFDVTPDMAEFNRTGSRFRVNAGTTAPSASPPPAQ